MPVQPPHPPPTDLIDDRHISSVSEDRLRHEPFADEVAKLVASVETPANVAVYAPWGSGKSGLGRLIEERLPGHSTDCELVIVDASKYAGASLRRHFVTKVAEKLNVKGDEYRHGLYRETTDKITVPGLGVAQALWLFVRVLAGAFAAGVVVAGVVAAIGNRSFWAILEQVLGFAGAPSALILAFLALAGQVIPVTRRAPPPAGDEEFEALFREVLGKAKTSRVVIFIDELDRCAPKDVVSTLETIRTFLGAERCVFVVAADQQVLERALRLASEQTNPANGRNPYYSTGSEYLDKIFQHQILLPPVLSRRLTRFALDLTDDLAGVWDEVDRREVLSVLIPTHVRSPRRVKALLNNYVTSYRIARGRLDGDLSLRAVELAKLVCLRCEFPLFAADLTLDPDLPERVLAEYRTLQTEESSRESPRETEDLSEGDRDLDRADARDLLPGRVHSYARAELPVDEILLAVAETPGQDEREEVKTAHAQQLISYLEKTEHVGSLRRDVIYLEAGGAATGVDQALADQLEEFSANGQRAGAISAIQAAIEPGSQYAILRHLAWVTRDASVGIEGRNGIATLLAAAGAVPELDLSPVATDIASAVSTHIHGYDLDPQDLAGAFLLGSRTHVSGYDDLVEAVLARDELLTDKGLGATVLAHLGACLPDYADRIAALLGASAVRDGDRAVPHLLALDDETLIAVLQPTGGRIDGHLSIAQEDASAAAEDAGGSAEVPGVTEAVAFADGLAEQLLKAGRDTAGEIALLMLLGLDSQQARARALRLLEGKKGIANSELAFAIPESARRRAASEWPTWLAPLATADLEPSVLSEGLLAMGRTLWSRLTKDPPEIDDAEAALASLTALGFDLDGALEGEIFASVGAPITDDIRAGAVLRAVAAIRIFGQAGVLPFENVAPEVPDGLVSTLAHPHPAPWPTSAPIPTALVTLMETFASHWTDAKISEVRDQVIESPWLSPPEKVACRVALATAPSAIGSLAIGPEEVRALDEMDGGLRFAANWVERLADPGMAAAYLAETAGEVVLEAVARRAVTDPTWAHMAIKALFSAQAFTGSVMKSLGADDVHANTSAECLIASFDEASNISDRKAVLQAWDAVDPTDNAARKKLIDRIALTMIRSERKVDLIEMLSELSLAVPAPHGLKGELETALVDAGVRHKMSKDVHKAMERHGLRPKSKSKGFWPF